MSGLETLVATLTPEIIRRFHQIVESFGISHGIKSVSLSCENVVDV